MSIDAWLPIGFNLPSEESLKKIIFDGGNWQLYEATNRSTILFSKASLAEKWIKSGLLDSGYLTEIKFGNELLYYLNGGEGFILEPLTKSKQPDTKSEALAFVESLKKSRELDQEASFHDAIYCERISRLLPIYSLTSELSDEIVLGSWLSGGVQVPAHSIRRITNLAPWLGMDSLSEIVKQAGFLTDKNQEVLITDNKTEKNKKLKFELPGRIYLEQFFNEHVIDIIQNKERYAALGINFPSAVILFGPPGCGKTFAAEKLVDYLEWPCFQIEASSVASPYIHETSKKVAEVFEQAIENSPSVLIMDEMEAFLPERQGSGGGGNHKIEEVAEFLRRIPEAINNNVLIIAMTNRIEMIDPAILRRGRFDHIIEVEMASEDEIAELLRKKLADIPHNKIDINNLSKSLVGYPLSDIAFMLREAARIAVHGGKERVGQEDVNIALELTLNRDNEKKNEKHRNIGFVWNDD
tara:strand:+ start:96 stop:1499 length:1404 start_codon:yes stop_codon:yes gene_type:complete